MNPFTILILFGALWVSEEQPTPKLSCTGSNPFKSKDDVCLNFTQVCLKTDLECTSFLDICKQCPLTNASSSMNIDIFNLLKGQSNYMRQTLDDKIGNQSQSIDSLKEDLRHVAGNMKTLIMIISFLFVLIIILIALILIEVRFKLITKYCESKKRGKRFYREKKKKEYERLCPFGFPDESDPVWKVSVDSQCAIRTVKEQLFELWPDVNGGEFKYVKCGSGTNARHLFICAKSVTPKFRDVASPNDLVVFKEQTNDKSIKELLDDVPVGLCQFKDADRVRVIVKREVNIEIQSISTDDNTIVVTISNCGTIRSLINKMIANLSCDERELLLFSDRNVLTNTNDYVHKYVSGDNCRIKYCFLKKVVDRNDCLEGSFGKINMVELRDGIFLASNDNLPDKFIIKKYPVVSIQNLNENKNLMTELNTFHVTYNHDRFLPLLAAFYSDWENESYFYIKTEYMSCKSVEDHLIGNVFVPNNDKTKWIKQMLEALKFLHEHGIIHRDLKPSTVLLDGNLNIKICGFSLSKYFENENDLSNPTKIPTNRYQAPELMNHQNYNEKADVWSFGAIVLLIVSGQKPYGDVTTLRAIAEISKSRNIPYEPVPETPEKFQKVIESCLRSIPEGRETVEKLLEIINGAEQ